MLALIVVVARLAQFVPAMVLFGTPLFLLYALPTQGHAAATTLEWPRPLLAGAGIVLAAASIVALCAQTAVMANSPADAFKWGQVASVVTDTPFGRGTALRFGLASLATLIALLVRPSRALWLIAVALGAVIVAGFAWTGHGANDDGLAGFAHLASDVFHLLAAGVWLGALAGLSILLLRSTKDGVTSDELSALHRALEGFSGIGSAIVAVLLATGLVNSWFLVGLSHLGELGGSAYGRVLLAKIALFGVMLGLAANNRFRLTPRLDAALNDGAAARPATDALRRSILLETAVAAGVLVLVSLLGTLEPLMSS
jgi:putative copper resistance protein D